MNKLNRLVGIAAMMAVGSIGTRVWAQGSLTPPGAPAPTMKTLTEVFTQVQTAEPRQPVARAPITLERPGSYYLTANLEGTVTISGDNVTLDLMGFTIAGPEGGNAITVVPGAGKNVRVHNGVLFLPTTVGIGLSAVGAGTGLNGRIESLRVTGGNYGIYVGNSCTVRDCQVTGANTGIRVAGNSVVRECRFEGNATGMRLSGTGALVENNVVRGNTLNYDFVAGNQLNLLLCQIPETLAWPCSVKLAGSFTGVGHGVTINASGVTLDLMGFTLAGDQGAEDYGVFVDGTPTAPIRDVVVRNGIIRNFGNGVRAEYANSSRFEHLIISSNSLYGVYFYGNGGQCNGNTIADCTVSVNGSYGVYLYSSTSGQCDGNALVDCAITGNTSHGLYLSGSYGRCTGNTVTRCKVSDNSGYGIYLYGYSGLCDGNAIADCAVSGNGSRGIYLSGYTGQCNGNIIADCAVSGNSYGIYLYGTSGLCDGNAITGCAINGNGVYGIYLNGASGQCAGNTIAHCVVRQHTTSGIYLSDSDGGRLEGNHISCQSGAATYGIWCESTANNLILRNTCVGVAVLTNSYIITANDTYGPIVSAAGALSTTGAAAHPWANFSR